MKGIEEFKEELMYDNELADYLYGTESLEELVEKAKDKGYEITIDDLQQDELTEDIYESVCGGAIDNLTVDLNHEVQTGDNSFFTDCNVDQMIVGLVADGKIDPELAKGYVNPQNLLGGGSI